VPLAGLVVGTLVGILCAETGAAWWVALLVVPGCLVVWRTGSVCQALALFAWLGMWAVHGQRLHTLEALEGRLPSGAHFEGRVVVHEIREPGLFQPAAVVSVLDGPGRGGKIGLRRVPAGVLPGDRLAVTGEARYREQIRNPGVLDRAGWQRGNGWAGEVWVEEAQLLEGSALRLWPRRVAWRLRGVVRERVAIGLDDDGLQAALIRALVLGERDPGQMEAFRAFRHSGTMHVFAVSGLHVGMIGLLAWGLLRLLRVPRWWGVWIVLGIVWTYALVTGLRPPALRAALMATVFLAGFLVRRNPVLGNALLASMPIVLLCDSFQWRQAGFQLSYLVVASIILVAPRVNEWCKRWWEGDPFLPRTLQSRWQTTGLAMRRKIGGLAVVSVAAWLGSLPLMFAHFGLVTPSAVLASVLLVPMVFVILGVAMVGLLAGLIWQPLEVGLNRVNGVMTTVAHRVAREFAAVPGSHFELGEPRWWNEGLVVFDLRGGNGAAYLGGARGLLLDVGGEDEFERVIYPAIRGTGSQPSAMVISHPDGGHCGGASGAVRAWPVRQILLPVEKALSPAFRRLGGVTEQEGARVLVAMEGHAYPLPDGAELEVIHAPQPGEGSRADDRCLVLRLHWKGWKILLTNDAGFETEQRILDSGSDVRSDLWIMGRHQTDYSATWQFVEAVGAQVIVATHHHFPVEERIPPAWAEAVQAEGISLWRQDETGAVAIEASADELRLRSFLGRREEVVRRR
jgi:ComEC/Rec2-related protein